MLYIQYKKSINHTRKIEDPKDIIILQIGLYDGRGDWIHGIEIARYINKKFSNSHNIVGFVQPDPKLIKTQKSDAMLSIFLFQKQFINQELLTINELDIVIQKNITEEISTILQQEIAVYESNFNGKLNENPFFHYFFNGHNYPIVTEKVLDQNTKKMIDNYSIPKLDEIYSNFIRSNKEKIFCEIQISHLPSCCFDITHSTSTIQMSEYGVHYSSSIGPYHLNMGFGRKCHGIRIYEVEEEDEIYWNKLKLENKDLFEKMITSNFNNYQEYLEHRKLLPGDLRNEKAIQVFIELNLCKYGSKCDFYFSKIKDCEKILEICNKYTVKLKHVTPKFDPNNENQLLNDNEIRIFSDFNLSDDLYNGLYFHNKNAGVGISGDNGWSLAISSCNLPFHGKISFVQEKVIKDVIKLASDLKLNHLQEYFFFLLHLEVDPIIEKETYIIIANNNKKIQEEYVFFANYVRNHMNIYNKLENSLEAIKNTSKSTKGYFINNNRQHKCSITF